jgi:hypothetical protein
MKQTSFDSVGPPQTVTFEPALAGVGEGPIALDLETYAVNTPGGDEALNPMQGEIRLVSLCEASGEPQLKNRLVILGGLTVEDLCQEIDKLLTGMPCGGFS